MRDNIELRENERVDDLQLEGLRIIQNTKKFCFGMDAVLLADFAAKDLAISSRVMDLGTGTGIIPLLLWGRIKAKEIIGLEIQGDMVEMAQRSIRLNHLEDSIKILEGDIKDPPASIQPNYFDAILTNPPYMVHRGGLTNPREEKAIARHEILCSLEDVIHTAKRHLKSKGKLFMVHRSQRLVDIISVMRAAKIEPKKIRLIYPNVEKEGNLVLIQGVKGGNPQVTIEKPLYVYNEKGDYTQEIYQIYRWEKDHPNEGGVHANE